jgi:hypothetical protein
MRCSNLAWRVLLSRSCLLPPRRMSISSMFTLTPDPRNALRRDAERPLLRRAPAKRYKTCAHPLPAAGIEPGCAVASSGTALRLAQGLRGVLGVPHPSLRPRVLVIWAAGADELPAADSALHFGPCPPWLQRNSGTPEAKQMPHTCANEHLGFLQPTFWLLYL